MQCQSEQALVQAINIELEKAEKDSRHGVVDISCSVRILANGIRCCSVQVECKGGCGHLIEAFGDDAEILLQEATSIQRLFKGVMKPSRNQFEILFSICCNK